MRFPVRLSSFFNFSGTRVAVGFTSPTSEQAASPIFEPVAFFLHRDSEASPQSWVTVYWEQGERSGKISLAPDHLIFVCAEGLNSTDSNACHPTAAKRLNVGDAILTAKENISLLGRIFDLQFVAKKQSQLSGLFAPATPAGTLLVDGVLVSQYSTFPLFPASLDSSMHWMGNQIVSPLARIAQRFVSTSTTEAVLTVLRSFTNLFISGSWLLWNSQVNQPHCKVHQAPIDVPHVF